MGSTAGEKNRKAERGEDWEIEHMARAIESQEQGAPQKEKIKNKYRTSDKEETEKGRLLDYFLRVEDERAGMLKKFRMTMNARIWESEHNDE